MTKRSALSLNGRDPRQSHREQDDVVFPLVRGPDGKIRLQVAGNSALAVDPQRGMYVRVDGQTTEVSSASPYAIRARLDEGIEVTTRGIRPVVSESVVLGRRGKLEARIKAEDVATDESGLDVQAALERLDDAKQNLNAKGVADGYASLGPDALLPRGQAASGTFTRAISFFAATSAPLVWTAFPDSPTLLLGSARHVQSHDLTGCTQVRLSAFCEVKGAGSESLKLVFGAAHSADPNDYDDIGDETEVSVTLEASDTLATSGWVALDLTASADVFIAIVGFDGDDASDGTIGSIYAEFR